MNKAYAFFCRAYQTVFRAALPILPYREPVQLDGLASIVPLLTEKEISSVLLVTDASVRALGLTGGLEDALKAASVACAVYDKTVPNPTIANIEEGRALYLSAHAQAIIAVGGGSVMDCAKIIGARIAKPRQPVQRMGGLLRILRRTPLLIAAPTTAGTGSETTLAAVITDSAAHHKYPINDFALIPDYAVLDPELTRGLPPMLTATTGMDALTHAVEAYVSTGATPLKEFISWESTNRELESWNMLYSQMASDMNVTTNLWEGLLSFDCYGKAVPSVAKEWSHNEDSSVWTFNLRDDVDWVDVNGEVKAHLTSKDFLVGLEWVLNAAKNQANNTSMPNETLTGAADYYQKTSDMGDAAADLTYQDMLDAGVGVEAPDDYTLVFTCKDPCPYFDTVAAYTSFYPASEDLINELGVEGFRSCDYTNMWYNGPYVVEEFISQNTKSYIPNPNYYAANDVSRFDRFTVTMISDGTVTFQLYQNRELDELELSESTLTTITSDTSNAYNDQLCEKRPTKYAYDFHFNFYCLNTDGQRELEQGRGQPGIPPLLPGGPEPHSLLRTLQQDQPPQV